MHKNDSQILCSLQVLEVSKFEEQIWTVDEMMRNILSFFEYRCWYRSYQSFEQAAQPVLLFKTKLVCEILYEDEIIKNASK